MKGASRSDAAPQSVEELEDRLSEPSVGAVAALAASPGDVVVLGAGGKMGPSLARMVRRAADRIGDKRRVIAVSRFSSEAAARTLSASGVEVVRADLGNPDAYASLPAAPNVIFMVGQKFGTSDAPGRTWFTNTVVPALAASRYRGSRLVVFSTGNVYALTPVARGGSTEGETPAPVGEYAMSCLGRERVFEHAAAEWGTHSVVLRLNYAVDLRYGVLVDLAERVRRGAPVDVCMGWVNCIWQGDANAIAVAALGLVAAPPTVVNLTGPEVLRVRDVATTLAARLGTAARFDGVEAPDALLSNTARCQTLLGAPAVSAHTLIDWVADWVGAGRVTLGMATRFEERTGSY